MGLFSKEAPEAKAARLLAEQQQEESLEALRQGGIPPRAKKRLGETPSTGGLALSGLGVNEQLLTGQAGFEVLGQVMGSSFYKVSLIGGSLAFQRQTGELAAMTQAQLAVRTLALSRLRQEAALLGAHGVVGVSLKIGRYDWSAGLIEFSAMGTAVRIKDRPAPSSGEPFTCALDGQDFWKLRRAGYLPREVAYGVCSYYLHTDSKTSALFGSILGMFAGNQEVSLYTEGFMKARELAMSRFGDELRRAQASPGTLGAATGMGAVGVSVDYDVEDIEYESGNRTYHDLLIHFAAVGTAITEGPAPKSPRRATLSILDLRSAPCPETSLPTPSSD